MNTVNRTALANLKQNKGKNILIGIAIFLTTILVFAIPTLGLGEVSLQFAAVNKAYPTFHVMYRNADQKTAEALEAHADVEELGLRQDAARIVMSEGTGFMIYMDRKALELSKVRLEEGNLPEEAGDIVMSRALLEELGISAGIGDQINLSYQPEEPDGLGYEKTAAFRICGLLKSTQEQGEEKMYSSLVSKAFMEQEQPEETRRYRVMLRVRDASSMTVDDIEVKYKNIAEGFGISEADIAENGDYLAANYVDPALFGGIALILLVVVLAGVITIYSIYYISMMYKVQEFGKLKALGASKSQIRQIVFREGMLVTCIAVPIGLLAGTVVSAAAIRYMVSSFGEGHPLQSIMSGILKENGGIIFKLWIYLLALAVVFLTVAVSLLRPMQIAAQISPVEAMRYDGNLKTKKKERKGHEELNLCRLTGANLSRNKKRTVITIVTLSLTGVLFMTVSSILACVDPEEIARDSMRGDMVIAVNSTSDKMHPELAWSQICQDNPLNESFEQKLMDVPGVEEIEKQSYIRADLTEVMEGDDYWSASIIGVPETYMDEIKKSAVRGSDFTYEELLSGDKIIMDEKMLTWVPDFKKTGDKVKMILECGAEKVEKEFEIAGICDLSSKIGFYSGFVLPENTLRELSSYNMSYYWSVSVEREQVKQAQEQIRKFVDEDKRLEMRTFEEELAYQEKTSGFLSQICYTFLVILGAVGIMNLVNTMINSIYIRRRELGIMQAIGLSEKQMVRMLQLEGLFYTAGTLVMSLSLGGVLGYVAFLFAKEDGMFGIVSYHYPGTQTLILVLVIAVIQILLTYLIMKNFRKQSMIERIRFSE